MVILEGKESQDFYCVQVIHVWFEWNIFSLIMTLGSWFDCGIDLVLGLVGGLVGLVILVSGKSRKEMSDLRASYVLMELDFLFLFKSKLGWRVGE